MATSPKKRQARPVGALALAGLGIAAVLTALAFLLLRPAQQVPMEDLRSPARRAIDEHLKQHRVAIFSKSYCPYSMRGKSTMRRHAGEAVGVMELDQRDDGPAIQDELLEMTGGRTVPRIFLDGKFLGGADDVAALEGSAELHAMLKEKGLLVES